MVDQALHRRQASDTSVNTLISLMTQRNAGVDGDDARPCLETFTRYAITGAQSAVVCWARGTESKTGFARRLRIIVVYEPPISRL